jgi:hypothetical protein
VALFEAGLLMPMPMPPSTSADASSQNPSTWSGPMVASVQPNPNSKSMPEMARTPSTIGRR